MDEVLVGSVPDLSGGNLFMYFAFLFLCFFCIFFMQYNHGRSDWLVRFLLLLLFDTMGFVGFCIMVLGGFLLFLS